MLGIIASVSLQAQQSYVSPKKVKSIFESHVVVRDFDDVKYLKEHLSELQHVDILRVEGEVDIAELALYASKIDALDEIQLLKYQGILSDADLENMEWVPHLYVYVPQNRIDAILLNNIWARISRVTLEFEQPPLDYSFFKGWKGTKSLRLLGDFNKPEAKAALESAYQFLPRLKQLEISLVSVMDLPVSITRFNRCALGVIDGAAWAQGTSADEMGKISIPLYRGEKQIHVGTGNNTGVVAKKTFTPLYWYSDQPELFAQEKRYLRKLFPEPKDADQKGFVFDEIKQDFSFLEPIDLTFNERPISQFKPLIEDFHSGKSWDWGTTQRDMVFLGASEWSVLIPKGALQYANGKPYKGDYRLVVNYMNSAERISAMGANLRYDTTSGKAFAIQPDFILDIEVFDFNSKPLKIKPGYRVQVRFATRTQKEARFYSYYGGKWKHFYDYDYEFDVEHEIPVDFYQFHHGNKTAVLTTSWEKSDLKAQFSKRGFQCMLNDEQSLVKIGKYKGFYLNSYPKQNEEQKRVVRGKNYFTIRFFKKNKRNQSPYQEFTVRPRDLELFPEWKSFVGERMAIHTDASYFQLMSVFKSLNLVDARMVKIGSGAQLEIKTSNQAWTLQLVLPKDRSDWTLKQREKEQKRWDRKILGPYLKRYETKNKLYASLSQDQYSIELNKQKETVLGTERLSPGYDRGGFFIQSFGRFAWGVPKEVNGANVSLILCANGKIPLKIENALVVSEIGRNRFFQSCSDQSKCNWKIDEKSVKYILAKSADAQLYYLKGSDYQRLGIKDQTLIYVDLNPLKSNEALVDDDLRKVLGIRSKRR